MDQYNYDDNDNYLLVATPVDCCIINDTYDDEIAAMATSCRSALSSSNHRRHYHENDSDDHNGYDNSVANSHQGSYIERENNHKIKIRCVKVSCIILYIVTSLLCIFLLNYCLRLNENSIFEKEYKTNVLQYKNNIISLMLNKLALTSSRSNSHAILLSSLLLQLQQRQPPSALSPLQQTLQYSLHLQEGLQQKSLNRIDIDEEILYIPLITENNTKKQWDSYVDFDILDSMMSKSSSQNNSKNVFGRLQSFSFLNSDTITNDNSTNDDEDILFKYYQEIIRRNYLRNNQQKWPQKQIPGDTFSNIIIQQEEQISIMQTGDIQDKEDEGEMILLSNLYVPLFNTSYPSCQYQQDDDSDNNNCNQLLGVSSVIIFWNDLFRKSIRSSFISNSITQNSISFVCNDSNNVSGGSSDNNIIIVLKSSNKNNNRSNDHFNPKSFTYNINIIDGTINYIKDGDMHNDKMDYLEEFITIPSLTQQDSDCKEELSSSYSIQIYPSIEYYNACLSYSPIMYTILISILFAAIFSTMVLYDNMINNEIQCIEGSAEEYRAIVHSFFPPSVRSRLFKTDGLRYDNDRHSKATTTTAVTNTYIPTLKQQQQDSFKMSFSRSKDSNKCASCDDAHATVWNTSEFGGIGVTSHHCITSASSLLSINRVIQRHRQWYDKQLYEIFHFIGNQKNRVKSFFTNHRRGLFEHDYECDQIDNHQHEEVDEFDEAIHWKPIADLFPYCTVLFADISGFTAWSSQREPSLVFTLLQILFRCFDKAAKKHGVFKVETIGDCYLCVTGLPDPQPDHAVRMVRFAREVILKTVPLCKKMERLLGPDTGDLRMRIGLHSGPVTAGVLRGEKCRFQLFGDTVNTASRMESTSERNRIQLSPTTADLVRADGKEHWIKQRSDLIYAKGKGEMQTYWVSTHSVENDITSQETEYTDGSNQVSSNNDPNHKMDEEDGGFFSAAFSTLSRSAKNERLVDWIVELMKLKLQKIVTQREYNKKSISVSQQATSIDLKNVRFNGKTILGEVVESFTPADTYDVELIDTEDFVLSEVVISQLHKFVTRIAYKYRENSFHNFEHACHVTMSVDKLLNRVVTPDDSADKNCADLHEYTYGIISDALAQFAIIFSALIHDVDHTGVGNGQLSTENPVLGEQYNNRSVAEQNSINLSWEYLMDPEFQDLQQCIFANMNEMARFRQLVVNAVLATDIFDKEGKEFREQRWDKAFRVPDDNAQGSNKNDFTHGKKELSNLKATIVIEHIIQASDVSHTMQHWNIYTKWNERLFREMYMAFDSGRSDNDPSFGWYKGELWFFDNYVIPLAKKLDQCNVFGVASDECLSNAIENRNEWEIKGTYIVHDMVKRYQKRKNMEIGGLTEDEISVFTPQDLEYIIRRLVEKGQNNSTYKITEKGQNDAAQAWLDALEIWERAPAGLEATDRSIIFPVFSGSLVWLKAGKIKQDKNCYFEQNLANIFVRESRKHGDPVHYTRALAMKCDVMGRLGKYDIAFNAFEKLKSVYDPEKHSAKIAKVYNADRSAHAFSQSALWHMQTGNIKAAIEICEYVIYDLFPLMDPKNTLGNFELLLPVFRTLKPLGQEKRMRDILNEKIVEAFYKYHGPDGVTPIKSLFKPMLMLLDICHNPDGFPNFSEEVEWLLVDENGVFPDFVDSIFMQQCWSVLGMTAEICLRFAHKIFRDQKGDLVSMKKLVQKGLRLATKVDKKMRNADGKVTQTFAYDIHEPVLSGLRKLAVQLSLEEEEVDYSPIESMDVKLPPSYLKHEENHEY